MELFVLLASLLELPDPLVVLLLGMDALVVLHLDRAILGVALVQLAHRGLLLLRHDVRDVLQVVK